MKCDSCGAPVVNGKCTYCGKVFSEVTEEPSTGSQQYTRPTTMIANNNNGSNQKFPYYMGSKTVQKKKKGMGCGTIIFIFIVIGIFGSIFDGNNNSDSSASSEDQVTDESVWASGYTDLGEFDYYMDGTELYIKDYNGKDKKIRISSTYTIDDQEYSVVALTEGTFALHSVDSVIVPEGVRSIEDNTFNSDGIKFVYLPSTLEEINSSFLSYFHDAEKIYYGGSEEQWNSLVSTDRADIDVKQIVFDAKSEELQ